MDDAIKLFSCKQLLHAGAVCHVHFHEAEVAVRRQARQPPLFQRDIVVVVQVVQPHQFVPARQQSERGGHADKAGCSSQKNFHGHQSSGFDMPNRRQISSAGPLWFMV